MTTPPSTPPARQFLTQRALRCLTAGALSLAFAGCSGQDIPPPKNEIKDLTLLQNMVLSRVERFDSARFKDAVLDYYGEQRIKVRQVLLVKMPGKLRVQTKMPASNEIISLLVANEQRFSMHKRDTNEYYTGRPTREAVNALLPLDLSPKDVVHVMLGGGPWDRFTSSGNPMKLAWNRETGRYRISTATAAGGALSMEVRPGDFAVVQMKEVNAKGKEVYTYTTKDWKRYGELSLPSYRRFVWPAKNLDFSIDVGETQLDVNPPDEWFEFAPPAGSQVIQVGP